MRLRALGISIFRSDFEDFRRTNMAASAESSAEGANSAPLQLRGASQNIMSNNKQGTVLTAANKITVHGPNGPVETTVGDLLKMGPALGVPAAPTRKLAKPATAPDLTKAIAGLKPTAGAVSSIVEAPKAAKTWEGVTITVTKEMVVVKEGEPAVEMLVLCKRAIADGNTKVNKKKLAKGTVYSHFNYAFDKGFCYYATKGATPPKPAWKWDDEREVRFIPVSEIETLLSGLRQYYIGATLVIDGKSYVL